MGVSDRYAAPVPIDPDLAEQLRTAGQRWREDVERRNRLIRQARTQGGSLREIAQLVGIDHTTVAAIVEKD